MEYLALYDDNDNLLAENVERSKKLEIEDGKYFRIIIVFIQNDDGNFLIQKVAEEKGNCFATTGGHVKYGASSIDTVIDEINEELGFEVNKEELTLFKTYKYPKAYQDVYYLRKNIDINCIKLQKEEVDSIYWMTIDEILELIKKEKFRKGNIKAFNELLEYQKGK